MDEHLTTKALSSDALSKAHSLQLYILKSVRDVCETHGIPFFLYFGTLLGAVRHNGFIPWDDDLDIGMKREAFERFVKIAPQALPDNLLLQHWTLDPDYGHLFAKVALRGTKWVLQHCEHIRTFQGVYIDIFPFDLIPTDSAKQRKHYKMVKSLARLLRLRCNYELSVHNAYLRWRNRLIAWWAKRISPESLAEKLQTTYRFGYDNSDANTPLCTAIGESYYGTMIPFHLLDKLEPHRFEDDSFPIPSEYDAILKLKYGDYMKVPPLEQRNGHNIVDYDFGIYQHHSPETK